MKTLNVSPLRWSPQQWDDIIGNSAMKAYFRNLARMIRDEYRRTGRIPMAALGALLLSGLSRSGKTSLVKFLVRCLMCQSVDADLNPCRHTCPACRDRPEVEGREGLFSVTATASSEVLVDLHIIDCGRTNTPAALEDQLRRLEYFPNQLTVVFLDEVHRLTRNSADEMLLKILEDAELLFILSSAHAEKLDTMLRNRTVELATELPTDVEFGVWIARRCREFGTPYQEDAIVDLVQKSNRVPGLALREIAAAAINPEGLTRELVKRST
jgi:Holliday junction resolvasome RuvABC ATP-dependent DNA helicase subunit